MWKILIDLGLFQYGSGLSFEILGADFKSFAILIDVNVLHLNQFLWIVTLKKIISISDISKHTKFNIREKERVHKHIDGYSLCNILPFLTAHIWCSFNTCKQVCYHWQFWKAFLKENQIDVLTVGFVGVFFIYVNKLHICNEIFGYRIVPDHCICWLNK